MVQVFSTMKDKPSAYPFLLPSETGVGAKKYYDYQPIEFSISTDSGRTWHSCFDDPELEGVYCYSAPDVQPATQADTLKKVGLQDGQRLLSTSYDPRQLTMQIASMDNIDEGSSLLGYDAMQQFLVSREPYWICFASWPQRMYYVRAKMSTPTYTGINWTATVTFTDLIGLSRSVNTSLNYEENIGFGNNMPNSPLKFTFSTNNFVLYNPSNVMINPRQRGHELKITLDGNSSGNMKLTNQTTGTEIGRIGTTSTDKDGDKVTGSSFNGKFVIDGVRTTLNGKSDYINSDKGFITIAQGDNHFTVDNFSGKITFDFPFWWLS